MNMVTDTDVLAQADCGPDLARGVAETIADPGSRAYALFHSERMAVRASYATYAPGYLEILVMVTGELQLTVWSMDGTPRPTGELECLLFLDGELVPLHDGGSYWRASVPLSRIAGLVVTLAHQFPAPPALAPALHR